MLWGELISGHPLRAGVVGIPGGHGRVYRAGWRQAENAWNEAVREGGAVRA